MPREAVTLSMAVAAGEVGAPAVGLGERRSSVLAAAMGLVGGIVGSGEVDRGSSVGLSPGGAGGRGWRSWGSGGLLLGFGWGSWGYRPGGVGSGPAWPGQLGLGPGEGVFLFSCFIFGFAFFFFYLCYLFCFSFVSY